MNPIALLLVGIGLGWAIGYVHACFVKDRERDEADRLKRAAKEAAERDARLDGLRSVR